MPEFNPVLVTAERDLSARPAGDGAESWHCGWIAAVDSQKNWLYKTKGSERAATFLRSAAKPFQAFPLVRHGLDKALTPEELAVCCASHVASAAHLARVEQVLAKAGLPESALQCGPHEPIDAAMVRQLKEKGELPRAIHNNCSGKHAGMLLACVRQSWDPDTYLSPGHPLQREILALLQETAEYENIEVAIDGCGAPVFRMPLFEMALLFARLGSAIPFQPVVAAMTTHPVMVGGEGRIDTVLMQVSHGALLAKVGAEGLIGVSRVGQGEGLVLKIGDGAAVIRELVVVAVLKRLGWLDDAALADPRLQSFQETRRFNTQGKVVGRYQCHLESG